MGLAWARRTPLEGASIALAPSLPFPPSAPYHLSTSYARILSSVPSPSAFPYLRIPLLCCRCDLLLGGSEKAAPMSRRSFGKEM
jgi:hypothetical protein